MTTPELTVEALISREGLEQVPVAEIILDPQAIHPAYSLSHFSALYRNMAAGRLGDLVPVLWRRPSDGRLVAYKWLPRHVIESVPFIG